MTVSFSTLEDAWGNNFSTNDKVKNDNIKRKKNKDPLCELYGKRYSKVSKSYSDMGNDDFSNNFASYNKNSTSRSMKNPKTGNNTRQEYYPIELDEYSSFASVKAIENIDDDEYLDNALDKLSNNNDDQNELLSHSVTVPNEDDDCSDNENPVPVAPVAPVVHIKEEHTNKNKTDNHIVSDDNEINYLDFGLYVTSGILLIFMMEQFIQLGLKMKSF